MGPEGDSPVNDWQGSASELTGDVLELCSDSILRDVQPALKTGWVVVTVYW